MLANINESYYKTVSDFRCVFTFIQNQRRQDARAHTRAHCKRLLPEFIWLVRSWRADVWRARPNAPDALRVSHISGSVGSPQLPSVCRRCSILWSCSRDPRGFPSGTMSTRYSPKCALLPAVCAHVVSVLTVCCAGRLFTAGKTNFNVIALCTYNFHMTV